MAEPASIHALDELNGGRANDAWAAVGARPRAAIVDVLARPPDDQFQRVALTEGR